MTTVGKTWLQQYNTEYPRSLSVPQHSMIDIFEKTTRLHPDRPAIYYYDKVITFREVDDYAERLATLLEEWGVGRGDRLAVYMQNDPQFLIAQYGAWKRGGIVVPLNPMLKERELEYHIADSGAKILICDQSLYPNTASVHTYVDHIMTINPDHFSTGDAFSTRSDQPLPQDCDVNIDMMSLIEHVTPNVGSREEVTPDDVAYIIYTSGTTGRPKGAMNLHRNVAFNAAVYQTWMNIDVTDIILGIAPLFHVTAIVGHIALSAISGAPLVLFHRFDPRVAIRMIDYWKPTMTVGSITAFIAIMNHPDAGTVNMKTLTKCYSGGAAVPRVVIEQFRERFGVYIHNIYGLTETNSPSHAVPLTKSAPVDEATGALSIGVPVLNCDTRVVDLTDPKIEVAIGELGELAVAGPMVFSGYWRNDEATSNAFVGSHFLTGDVVRMDEDGWFYVVDRKKDMINASGFKVWPREVEDVLYEHPAVKEAAVIGVPDEYRGETVKAIIALRDSYQDTITPGDIVEFCKSRMAAYKYPRQVEFVREIPKTLTGKILRRELRK